jgi:hypothetical protein
MKLILGLIASWATVVLASPMRGQAPPVSAHSSANKSWAFNLAIDGYIVPDEDGYVSPIIAADRGWLHLEARYNYEDLRTGSLWAGYTFTAGKTLVLSVTPMIGGVFGRTTGIAPGLEASLTYKKLELSISNEFVVDTKNQSSNFYYDWPQLTYSPIEWLHLGLVAQRTKVYHTGLDTQRGFLFGVSHKQMEFTTYIFNAGSANVSAILEAGFSF